MNALGIDPKNLSFEFKRDWQQFQGSRVQKFLVFWLEKELKDSRSALENVTPADLGKAQGVVAQIKKVKNLLERPFCDEPLKEVVAFLESR